MNKYFQELTTCRYQRFKKKKKKKKISTENQIPNTKGYITIRSEGFKIRLLHLLSYKFKFSLTNIFHNAFC